MKIIALSLWCAALLEAQEPDAALVFTSFQHTFPDKITKIMRADGDWAAVVEGQVFYWAQGRILPSDLRHQWESYRPQPFMLYPKEIPDPSGYGPEQIEALRNRGGREARLGGDEPHNGFRAALYGGITRREVELRQVKTAFLGRQIVVHERIAEAIRRIDARITGLARENPEAAAFIASIDSAGGYNWRQIQGTRRMSYHSWGLAVDIQPKPKEAGNKAIYWLWERAFNDNWMTVPLERRWIPPAEVVRAFENEGFIWGGRWALYDNMHFEYRPELHEANRLLAAETIAPDRAGGAPDLHHIYPFTLPPEVKKTFTRTGVNYLKTY
ncbi:MAG: M15 family metallopeptidase [Spirochaetaceae bacterium]|jgi:hypothetical protein|nr:M15 family metallopeptidase [Spirochaetaceae bacterium]